jgi:hypothetical protein
MSRLRDIITAMVIVFMSGEIAVTGVSFMFGDSGRLLWAIAQVGLVLASAMIVGMMFASKYRDEK